jgi:hypothetical protein
MTERQVHEFTRLIDQRSIIIRKIIIRGHRKHSIASIHETSHDTTTHAAWHGPIISGPGLDWLMEPPEAFIISIPERSTRPW